MKDEEEIKEIMNKSINYLKEIKEYFKEIVNLFEDHFYDGGSITVDGARLHCWKAGGHGAETYLQVVENSCNLVSW